MEDLNWTTIIVAIIAAIFGSIIGPLINASAKREEMIFNNRKELIKNAKKELLRKGFSIQKYIEDESYLKIKQLLSIDTINKLKKFNNSEIILVNGFGDGLSHYRNNILDDLNKKEEEWKLI